MEKEFVTYEQALTLKELGFKEDCLASYYHAGKRLGIGEYINHGNYTILAPLKQQVFRWFRENYGWIGGIRQLSSSGSSMIVGEFRKDDDNNFILFRDTYEEVENACIDELIEIAKQQGNGMESNS
jgi:hypothetical protein